MTIGHRTHPRKARTFDDAVGLPTEPPTTAEPGTAAARVGLARRPRAGEAAESPPRTAPPAGRTGSADPR
jgi:hypothetical protein